MTYRYQCQRCLNIVEDGGERIYSEEFDQERYNEDLEEYTKYSEYQEAKKKAKADYETLVWHKADWLEKLMGMKDELFKDNFDLDHYMWKFHNDLWWGGYHSFTRTKPNKSSEKYLKKRVLCPVCVKETTTQNETK